MGWGAKQRRGCGGDGPRRWPRRPCARHEDGQYWRRTSSYCPGANRCGRQRSQSATPSWSACPLRP